MPLTPKQKAFADYYLELGNATEAARRAGYKQPHVQGSQNLGKLSVSQYISERQKQIEDSRIADVSEVMKFYSSVLRGEIKDQFNIDASLSDRIAAGKELMKRYEKADAPKDAGVTIINNIPREI